MFVGLRKSIGTKLEVAAEAVGLAASLSGAAAAVVFGKALAAIALGSIALGLFLRLTGRRTAGEAGVAPSVPWWTSGVAVVLSALEGAVLVEATNLPVRFSQPGFAPYHWALVIAFLVVAYWVQRRLLGSVLKKQVLPPAP